jgi:hypothetical protein
MGDQHGVSEQHPLPEPLTAPQHVVAHPRVGGFGAGTGPAPRFDYTWVVPEVSGSRA